MIEPRWMDKKKQKKGFNLARHASSAVCCYKQAEKNDALFFYTSVCWFMSGPTRSSVGSHNQSAWLKETRKCHVSIHPTEHAG